MRLHREIKTRNLKVSEFADIYSGGTPSTADSSYWGGDIAWITPKDMSSHSGVYIRNGERFINELGLQESSACIIPANTVILSSRAPVGYVAVAENPLTTSQGCKNLKCKEELADPIYVYYLLKNNTAKLKSHATGTTFGELAASRLRRISFNLPEDVGIQREIASFLLAYDNLIENNRRRIELLEKAARLIYEEWFIHLRFPGYENTKIVDGVPAGWGKIRVGEIADLVRGKSYRSDNLVKSGGKPFINLKCFVRCGGFRLNGVKRFSGEHKDTQVVRPGDIVIALTDVTRDRLIVAHPARIPEAVGETAVFSMDVVKVIPKHIIDKSWFYYFLLCSGFARTVCEYASGTTVLHLKPHEIEKYEFFCPPKHIQVEYGRNISDMLAQQDNLLMQNKRLTEARDLLLPKLMNGEIITMEELEGD